MTTTRSEGGWDDVYNTADAPPWDIGRPQPVFRELIESGAISGRVLDAGCGTGEHSLLAAQHGASVVGVDLSPTAISGAREKSVDRGLDVRFEAGDILTMELPDAPYDCVIDSGLFHVFDDDNRARYVAVLTGATGAGSRCFLMCFSERQPGDWGPRRVTEAELRAAFADGWTVDRIEPRRFEINPMPEVADVDAWLAVFIRI